MLTCAFCCGVFLLLVQHAYAQVAPSNWTTQSGCWTAPITIDPSQNSDAQIQSWVSGTFENLWDELVSDGVEDTIARLTTDGVGFATGFVLEFFSDMPTVGNPGYAQIEGLVRDGTCIRNAEANKNYRLLCAFYPGDEFFVPETITIQKRTGLFTWQTIIVQNVLNDSEYNQLGSTMIKQYLFTKNSFRFTDVGTYRIIYGSDSLVINVTQDTTPPTMISFGVSTSPVTSISVLFSEDMMDSTFTSSTISVVGSISGCHSCSFSFDHTSLNLTILPLSSFVYGETAIVTLGMGIKDLAGNSLSASYQFTIVPVIRFFTDHSG